MTADPYYQPNSEQRALAAAFADSIIPLLPVSRLHESNRESAVTWAALEQLGLFGIAVKEDVGGIGLGAVEEALVVATCLGRCLASPAILATLGAVHARMSSKAVQQIRVGAAFDRGGVTAIDDTGVSAFLVRSGRDAAFHMRGSICGPIDNHLWIADLIEITDIGERIGTFDEAGTLRLRLIDAAALAGLAQAALEMAIDYAKLREQFGRPIGSFQAVKHHCANMAIAARGASDLVTFAAVAIDRGRADSAIQVESAFITAAAAALENAARNIQIHGGIGFSDEAHPHLFMKRAQLQVAIGGGVEAAIERLGDLRVEEAA